MDFYYVRADKVTTEERVHASAGTEGATKGGTTRAATTRGTNYRNLTVGRASQRQGPEVPNSGYRDKNGRQGDKGAKGLTRRSGSNLGNTVISNLRSAHDQLSGYIY